ncbi:hypothetical protein J6590_047500 [Homalodisca vitripennis]|nr:hypothetical protein J6590_047500 [Homalodisca vitripennis]
MSSTTSRVLDVNFRLPSHPHVSAITSLCYEPAVNSWTGSLLCGINGGGREAGRGERRTDRPQYPLITEPNVSIKPDPTEIIGLSLRGGYGSCNHAHDSGPVPDTQDFLQFVQSQSCGGATVRSTVLRQFSRNLQAAIIISADIIQTRARSPTLKTFYSLSSRSRLVAQPSVLQCCGSSAEIYRLQSSYQPTLSKLGPGPRHSRLSTVCPVAVVWWHNSSFYNAMAVQPKSTGCNHHISRHYPNLSSRWCNRPFYSAMAVQQKSTGCNHHISRHYPNSGPVPDTQDFLQFVQSQSCGGTTVRSTMLWQFSRNLQATIIISADIIQTCSVGGATVRSTVLWQFSRNLQAAIIISADIIQTCPVGGATVRSTVLWQFSRNLQAAIIISADIIQTCPVGGATVRSTVLWQFSRNLQVAITSADVIQTRG